VRGGAARPGSPRRIRCVSTRGCREGRPESQEPAPAQSAAPGYRVALLPNSLTALRIGGDINGGPSTGPSALPARKRTSATTKLSNTGPIHQAKDPEGGGAADGRPRKSPASTPRPGVRVSSGRRTFSAIHSARAPAGEENRRAPVPAEGEIQHRRNQHDAGAGRPRKAATVASTPNTTGEGSPTMAKPTPTKIPWMIAVTVGTEHTARGNIGQVIQQTRAPSRVPPG